MTILHLEPGPARTAASKMNQFASDLMDVAIDQARQVRKLDNDWEGTGAAAFHADYAKVVGKLDDLAFDLLELAKNLDREIDQWVRMGSSFGKDANLKFFKKEQPLSEAAMGLIRKQQFVMKWELLTRAQKLELLRKISDDLCDQYGVQRVKVNIKNLSYETDKGGTSGAYREPADWFSNIFINAEIRIDEDLVDDADPFEVMEVLAHETRHRMQHYWVDRADDGEVVLQISQKECDDWKYNFENRISAKDNYEGYTKQETEKDARNFGEAYANTLEAEVMDGSFSV